MSRTTRTALWLALVLGFITLQYAAGGHGGSGGKSGPQYLYEWSFAAAGLIQVLVTLLFVFAIAGFKLDLFALVRPLSWTRAAWLILIGLVSIYAFSGVYSAIVHPGNEQGLTPSHWEPAHAAAYIVNGIIICTVIPFSEELTFRGLGFSLLQQFGRWPAILAIGILFGLAHGLVISLPILALFGCFLAWLRSETRSVYPCIVLHGLFNFVALVAAVTLRH
jgi:membrane protease YdiL (CAAX protease family)